MMVGWSDGGAPSAQAVPSDADAVTGAQRDPTQLDLTSHIRSRIKRRGLGKVECVCVCRRLVSLSPEVFNARVSEAGGEGESDARGGQRVQGVKEKDAVCVQGRKGRRESKLKRNRKDNLDPSWDRQKRKTVKMEKRSDREGF